MQQVAILESALAVHEKVVSADILPLHSHLVQRFVQMQKSVGNTSIPPLSSASTPMSRKMNRFDRFAGNGWTILHQKPILLNIYS